MKELTSRERILCALNHEIPDRVPIVLWGSYYSLNDDTYFNLLNLLNIQESVTPFRRYLSRNSNYYDDRVLDRLGTDSRYIWSGFTDIGGANLEKDGVDAWGIEWKRSGPYIVNSTSPLEKAKIDDVDAYDWPNPEKYLDIDLMRERNSWLKSNYSTHAIGARAVTSAGPFEQASILRGRENLLMDMIGNEEFARAIIDKCAEVIIRIQEMYLGIVGADIDFIEIPGDDYGANETTIMSPKMFRTIIKPALAKIVQSIKQYRKDLPVVFHTDGAITELIPDFIDIGIDVLNPLEPLPANDWALIKEKYDEKLCFMGGIDIREAMIGSEEDVIEEVKNKIAIFAKNGGYILTTANHLQADIPPENIITLVEACHRYGQYPIAP